MKAGTSTEAGFTLIELTLVIALLGLLLGLVMPRLPAIGENRLEASARRIAGMVRYLYNEAALSGLEHRLTFDLDKNALGGRKLETDGELVALTGSGREHTLSSSVDIVDVSIPGRNRINSGQVNSRIFPVGWMDETVIHLKSDDRTLTLHMQPLTGTTDIY
ncbi:MAG: prepilin-type N-terminal cleavage/methylation domain-containing protein, partial [Desulfuromonadales bacterium]|nr:prepilin-type N-terminal cleavage/methylation domain-containing protein [Desulfuromonadales bacterium]